MNFRLLGPLEVSTDRSLSLVRRSSARCWHCFCFAPTKSFRASSRSIPSGVTPPDRAANALQVYVHGLRKLLGRDRITRRGTGYSLHVESEELDILRFELLLDQAQSAYAMGEPEVAGVKLGEALGPLVRGPPLSDSALWGSRRQGCAGTPRRGRLRRSSSRGTSTSRWDDTRMQLRGSRRSSWSTPTASGFAAS